MKKLIALATTILLATSISVFGQTTSSVQQKKNDPNTARKSETVAAPNNSSQQGTMAMNSEMNKKKSKENKTCNDKQMSGMEHHQMMSADKGSKGSMEMKDNKMMNKEKTSKASQDTKKDNKSKDNTSPGNK